MQTSLPRNLGLELVRATETAALTAGRWIGLGRAAQADQAAAAAMLQALNEVNINGTLVMGEENKPHSPHATHSATHIGNAQEPLVDIVIDPIDGLVQLAKGYPGAIAAAAVAPRGSIWSPQPAYYMDKIVVAEDVAPYLVAECLGAPVAWTLDLIARAKGVQVNNLSVFVLDRPRHTDLVEEIRLAGAHVILRPDGDINGALLVCTPRSGVDVMLGTGGIPEGLLAACAIQALGGAILGRLDPQCEPERLAILEAGLDLERVYTASDLVNSDEIFFAATGITDGPLLEGVIYHGSRATTNSLVLRGQTRTRRRIFAEHQLDKWSAALA